MANPISRDPAEEGETGSVAGQPDQDLNRAPDQNQAGNRGQMGGTDPDQMATVGEGGVGDDRAARDMNYAGGAADTNTTPGYTGPYANPTDASGTMPSASPGYGNMQTDHTGTTDVPRTDTTGAMDTTGATGTPGTMDTMGSAGTSTTPDNRRTMGNTGQTGTDDTMSGTGLTGAPSPADTSDTGLTGTMAPNERERMQSGIPDTPDTPDTMGQGLTGDEGMTPGTRQGGV